MNITNPPGTGNYPFWNPLPVQRANAIPGQLMAGVIADLPLNQTPMSQQFEQNNVGTVPVPRVAQGASEAAKLQAYNPVLGTGSGPSLMDYMMQTITQQRNQGKE